MNTEVKTEEQTTKSAEKAQQILRRQEQLKQMRDPWESLWQELSDYMLPGKTSFHYDLKSRNSIAKTFPNLYDSTAAEAANKAAAGLYSRATNPASKWFYLKPPLELKDDPNIKMWMETARDITQEYVNRALALPMHQTYLDGLVLGTAVHFLDGDEDEVIRGRVFSLDNCWIAENSKGVVDTVFRRFVFSARQAVQEFGEDSVGSTILDKAKDKPDDLFQFLHCVYPREDYKVDSKNNKDMPIASIYVCTDTNEIVKESGYEEFPYQVWRPDQCSGETYGRSPGMLALPEAKSLNEIEKISIDSAHMQVRPALDVPDEAYITPISLTPGALNYNQDAQGRKITAIQTNGDLNFTFQEREQKRAAIREIFFNDRLQLVQGPTMTAYEVNERVKQQMALMGPWLGRLEREFYEPLITRAFALLGRAGKFGQIPPQLVESGTFSIMYDSPLARAQRIVDVEAIDSTKLSIANNMQAGLPGPELFNLDEMERKRAEDIGLPSKFIKPAEQVMQERQQAQQQAAQQQQMAQGEQLANTAKTISEIPGGDKMMQQGMEQLQGAITDEQQA